MYTLDPAYIPVVAAIVGALVGSLLGAGIVAALTHYLTKSRDRANKARENAVVHLISAYRTFSKATGRAHLWEIGDELAQAIGDVHLFGRPEEIALVQKFIANMLDGETAELDPLLKALRSNYRDQVGLPPVTGEIHWLRVVDPTSEDASHLVQIGGRYRVGSKVPP